MKQFSRNRLIHISSLFLLLATLASHAFGQTLTTIYNFGATPGDGQAPGSGVVIDKAGNLFGTTGVGGVQGSFGTVFELTPPAVAGNAWTETILHRFNGSPDGRNSQSRLVMTATGALVGTTLLGGAENEGTVYMVAPPVGQGNWRERILHSFGTIPGDVVTPNYGLMLTPEGFYGVDQVGANGFGAVYLLTPSPNGKSWTQNILYSFKGSSSGDGADPGGELARDAKGNFYGVTGQGGANNLGAVYEVSQPAAKGGPWTEAVLYSFNGTDGTLPAGPLRIGAGGVLYGTTDGGGANGAGTVFQLTPPAAAGDPWTHTILHTFGGTGDGTSPENGVILDKKGRLFGTAGQAIFMLKPPQVAGGDWNETVLHTFSGPDGFVATTPLTVSGNTLYGTTELAGAFGHGTAFQLTLP